jgi:acyl carrier protein
MSKEMEFVEKISEVLEVDPSEISMETDFRNEVPFWDSLKGFGIIVLIEEDYGKRLYCRGVFWNKKQLVTCTRKLQREAS